MEGRAASRRKGLEVSVDVHTKSKVNVFLNTIALQGFSSQNRRYEIQPFRVFVLHAAGDKQHMTSNGEICTISIVD